MKKTVEWLVGLEASAERLYRAAASRPVYDKKLNRMLTVLADEEHTHYEFMQKAAALLEHDGDIPSLVEVSDEFRERVEKSFSDCEKKLEKGLLSSDELVGLIVDTEFSEWIDVFVYTLNALKKRYKELAPGAISIQRHKRHIEHFIESDSNLSHYLEKVRRLDPVWTERILVVDDEDMIVDVMKVILKGEGIIDSASNGKEAMEKLAANYYAAIVSDVDMHVMNGIEFYKEAVRRFPNIKERFLFFTSIFNRQRLEFFENNSLKCLKKPSDVGEIRKSITDILLREA